MILLDAQVVPRVGMGVSIELSICFLTFGKGTEWFFPEWFLARIMHSGKGGRLVHAKAEWKGNVSEITVKAPSLLQKLDWVIKII